MKPHLKKPRGIYITIRHVCKLCKIGKNKKHTKRIKMQIVFYKGEIFCTDKERNLIGVIPKGFLNTSEKKVNMELNVRYLKDMIIVMGNIYANYV